MDRNEYGEIVKPQIIKWFADRGKEIKIERLEIPFNTNKGGTKRVVGHIIIEYQINPEIPLLPIDLSEYSKYAAVKVGPLNMDNRIEMLFDKAIKGDKDAQDIIVTELERLEEKHKPKK